MIKGNKMPGEGVLSPEPFSTLRRRVYSYLILLGLLGNLIGFINAELTNYATPTRRIVSLFTIFCLLLLAILASNKRLPLKTLELGLFFVAIVLSLTALTYLLYGEYPIRTPQNDLLSLFIWLPGVYIMTFFVFTIQRALRISLAFLALLVLLTLPHSLNTLGGKNTFDGVFTFSQIYLSELFTIIAIYGFSYFKAQALKQEKEAQELRELARRDALTNLTNRRHVSILLEKEIRRAERYMHEFSIILFDIDDFKRINDHSGHDAGDEVLKNLALLLKQQLRASDEPARWGGEEFLILLPETPNEKAIYVAQTIRQLISKTLSHQQTPITVSGGVATYRQDDSLKSLIKRADLALYKAKRNGKDCIVNQESIPQDS
jgi:diguanylate cyclase (GGDEF)-like protein